MQTHAGEAAPGAVVSVSQLVTSKDLLESALAYVEEGEYAEALPLFARLLDREPRSARLRSYHALCHAVTERCFDEGVERCHAAAKQEFFNPELYLNLARLYLAFGFKAEGVRFIRRGLMIDPSSEPLSRALVEVGARTPPVLAFLPRRHLLNRWLGHARTRLARLATAVAA